MPSHLAKIRIYLKLHERLQNKDYPSKKELIEFVRDMGEDISERSLDRYRTEMGEEFGWFIKNNRSKGGYELIQEPEALPADSLLEVFGQSLRLDFLSTSIKDGKAFGEIVQFEKRKDYPGIAYLEHLYIACRERKQVHIIHRKFGAKNPEQYTIHPILLKEYLNRWYVIAHVPVKNDKRTFGLERIESIEVSSETFPETKVKKDLIKKFNNMVGLDDRHENVEKVQLRFSGVGISYEKTLPIHESATIIEESANYTTFEYTLIPNFELIQRILAQADRVEVLAPAWLRKEVADYLQKSILKYKK